MTQTSSRPASGLSASALVVEYHSVFSSVGKFSLRLFATSYGHKTSLRHKNLKRKHLHKSRAIILLKYSNTRKVNFENDLFAS